MFVAVTCQEADDGERQQSAVLADGVDAHVDAGQDEGEQQRS